MDTKIDNLKHKKWAVFSVVGLLLLSAMVLGACSKETPTPLPPPISTNTPAATPVFVDVNQLYANPWVLVGYGDPANPTVIEEGLVITLEFMSDGQLGVFSGCNNYSGTFQAASDGTLAISPLATTRMACPTGIDQESVYLTALQSTRSFNFNNQGRLSLTYSDPSQPDQVLIYTSGAKSLTDTNWILVSYGDPAAPQAVPEDTVITAVFSTDGMLSGFSGCNQYSASYTIQEQ